MIKNVLSVFGLVAATAFIPFAMATAQAVSGDESYDSVVVSDDAGMSTERNSDWTCWASGRKPGVRGNIVGMSFSNLGSAQRSVLRRCASLGYSRCYITGCRQNDQ